MSQSHLNLKVSDGFHRQVRLVAANMGVSMSDFMRMAITEKIDRLSRAARDNPHPNAPVGTPDTAPVECSTCGRTEVRTTWELGPLGHGKCRAEPRCTVCDLGRTSK